MSLVDLVNSQKENTYAFSRVNYTPPLLEAPSTPHKAPDSHTLFNDVSTWGPQQHAVQGGYCTDANPPSPTSTGAQFRLDQASLTTVPLYNIFKGSQSGLIQGFYPFEDTLASFGQDVLPDRAAVSFGDTQYNFSGQGLALTVDSAYGEDAGSSVFCGGNNLALFDDTTHAGKGHLALKNTEIPVLSDVELHLLDNKFQSAMYAPGQVSHAQPGFDLLDLEYNNELGNSKVRDLRQLAPQPLLADVAPSHVGVAPQPTACRPAVHECDNPGCTATFGRPAEFRRHKRTVHKQLGAPEFQCMVQSCSYTYPRLDKVREHMRRMHGIRIQMEKA